MLAREDAPEVPTFAFDGRDVTDGPLADDVQGYTLLACAHCGTVRDARYPFCCEMAGEPAPGRELVLA
jgi:hypothetical protein